MMRTLSWLWRRWGQMLAFSMGAANLVFASGRENDIPQLTYAVVGIGLLLTGVGLRATSFWREAKAEEARRADPTPGPKA